MYFKKLTNDDFKFHIEKKSDDSLYIFYIIDNNVKILTKYTKNPYLVVDKEFLKAKKLTIQCYYNYMGNKVKEELNNFLFKHIKYTRGYLSNNYDEIIKNGYSSIDGKNSILLQNINWEYQNNHNFNFNVHSLRFLSAYWGKYLETYNYIYIVEGLEIFKNFWKEIHVKKLNKFKKYDMALGIRALHIYFLSHFLDFFSSKDLKFYQEIYDFHYLELKRENSISLNNHGIWQVYGLRMLILVKNDNNVSDINYCIDQLQILLNYSFNDENVHVENSPFYHNYVVNLFSILPIDLFVDSIKLKNILNSSNQITEWLCDNKSHYFQIGDSHGSSNKRLNLSNITEDMTINEFKFYSKIFLNSGYFIVRNVEDEFNAFVLSCTNDTLIHKHVDNLSFILWHKNIELITDSGPYAYEYNKERDYCLSDKAHNVLSMQDHIFSLNDININESKINNIKILKEAYEACGTSAFNTFSYERVIKYFPLKRVEINDRILKNENNENITFNLTFGVGVEAIKINNFVILQYNGRIIAKIESISAIGKINLFYGNTEPMRGWISKAYNIIIPTYALEFIYGSDAQNIDVIITLY